MGHRSGYAADKERGADYVDIVLRNLQKTSRKFGDRFTFELDSGGHVVMTNDFGSIAIIVKARTSEKDFSGAMFKTNIANQTYQERVITLRNDFVLLNVLLVGQRDADHTLCNLLPGWYTVVDFETLWKKGRIPNQPPPSNTNAVMPDLKGYLPNTRWMGERGLVHTTPNVIAALSAYI